MPALPARALAPPLYRQCGAVAPGAKITPRARALSFSRCARKRGPQRSRGFGCPAPGGPPWAETKGEGSGPSPPRSEGVRRLSNRSRLLRAMRSPLSLQLWAALLRVANRSRLGLWAEADAPQEGYDNLGGIRNAKRSLHVQHGNVTLLAKASTAKQTREENRWSPRQKE